MEVAKDADSGNLIFIGHVFLDFNGVRDVVLNGFK